jgi:hypothetical protein
MALRKKTRTQMKQAQAARKKAAKSRIPHYTREMVLDLFKANDPRIRTNDYGTEKALVFSEEPGFFKVLRRERRHHQVLSPRPVRTTLHRFCEDHR